VPVGCRLGGKGTGIGVALFNATTSESGGKQAGGGKLVPKIKGVSGRKNQCLSKDLEGNVKPKKSGISKKKGKKNNKGGREENIKGAYRLLEVWLKIREQE